MENKFEDGKIYAIRSHKTELCYIGSTCQILSKRFYQHKKTNQERTRSREILKYDDVYIELIELFPCNNKMELDKREGEIIRDYGNKCVNCRVEGQTLKEYRDNNKDFLNEQSKIYYKNNVEARAEYNKEYRDLNKDKIREDKKKYREENKDKIKELKIKQYEENKDEILEKHKNYYLHNAEQIKEKRRAYHEVNKEEINKRRVERYKLKKTNI